MKLRIAELEAQLAASQPAQGTLPPLPEDDSIVHIYPSDLARMEKGEVRSTVFSVAVGCINETSVPLYTADQMREYALAALARPV